jgi:hypothetical protein
MSRTVGTNKPLIFISHKHIDRAIANVVRSLITEQSAGNVRVFQSSDPEAMAPRVGRTLNTELRQALWEASAVILVYTSQVGKAVQQQLPGLRWTAMSSIGDRRSYAPVLTRVRNLPAAKMLQFDVYFYPFNLLDATPAASRMIRAADMFSREIPPGGEGAILIFDLLRDLEEANAGPVRRQEGRPGRERRYRPLQPGRRPGGKTRRAIDVHDHRSFHRRRSNFVRREARHGRHAQLL